MWLVGIIISHTDRGAIDIQNICFEMFEVSVCELFLTQDYLNIPYAWFDLSFQIS